ncbi:DMT family transporter [Streptomyces sp. NBC_01571]|uniref:hypothetical protein n=1 Tax=Streptomyces sp. NBC_01571 TaxID=2975883 RepID=UPI002256567D|nr:hypothetical protein [Streptomyces sp. NBC_01571]MCX4580673.1 DMT family transporter [Streptomyces sp. NBC_01571]
MDLAVEQAAREITAEVVAQVEVAADTASLLIALAPVFSVLLGSPFLEERLSRRSTSCPADSPPNPPRADA